MKRCSECGENYDDRVDFCFGDGATLEMVEAPVAKSTVATPSAKPFLAGLEVPDAENFSGLDVPEPDGFSFPEPESIVEPPAAPKVEAPARVSSQEPGVVETRQNQESANLPVGFIDPPSQSGPAPAMPDVELDDDFDDLDFPAEFGAGDFSAEEFGHEDYTEPTIPAPRRNKRPTIFIALGMGALVFGMGIKVMTGGGSETETQAQNTLAKLDGSDADVTKPTVREQEPGPAVGEEELAPEVLEEDLPAELPDEEDVEPDGEGEAELEPELGDVQSPEEITPDRAVEPKKPVPEVVTTPESLKPDVVAPVVAEAAADDSPWGAVQAKAKSLVRIYSKPSGAIVFVDGRQRGKTPAEIELSDGQHSIRVEKDGYFSEDRKLKVSKPSHLERFKLNARDQRVTVNCYGPDASKVYLDGAVVCAIPGSGTLAVGKHTFRVVTPDRFFKMDLVVEARADGSPTPLRFTD